MLDELKQLIANKKLSFADLAHELGICEMSARNKVAGKTSITKLEAEKIESLLIINKEANTNV